MGGGGSGILKSVKDVGVRVPDPPPPWGGGRGLEFSNQ